MKAFELQAFGLENLKQVERPTPPAEMGQVVVRVHAVSLNYRDLLVVQGRYNPKMKLPRIPVSDGAGEVVAVGEGVTTWKTGDRVVVPFMPAWLAGPLTAVAAGSALGGDVDGLLSDHAAFPAAALLPIPPHLDFAQAACLPCAAVTAWNGLFVSGGLKPGATVLIQGTGGVSIFGLQFSLMAGADVIAISSSDEKLSRAAELGARHLINYKTEPDWEKRVLEITNDRGVDMTLEVGGTGTLSRTLKATAYAGEISLIGVLTGISGDVRMGHVLHKAVQLHGIYVGSRAMFADMNAALVLHQIEPVIDRVFGFDEVPEAFRRLESGRHFGKIAIAID